ncbi:MAG: GNAT family N-acetyltransferase [Myxococcota bacterium]|nr:GNAT family N-acetyltransferase [Myxococcota bacterium]
MVAKKLNYRPVYIGDFDFLWQLHRQVYHAHVNAIWGWDELEQKRRFEESFADHEADRRIIEVNGEAVGELELEHRADVLFVANIKIQPEMQNQGIGREIFQQLKRVATDRRECIELFVFRNNRRALNFYREQGFEEFGQTASHRRLRWTAVPGPSVMPDERVSGSPCILSACA